MRRFLFTVGACVTFADTAFAGDDRVKTGPELAWVTRSELMDVPADADGLMFVRRQDAQVHLDEQGAAEYSGYRIRLLHPNALHLGNISLRWNPASGAPTVHTIKVHRGDKAIDVLKSSTFEVLRREDQLEAAKLDGNLTAVLRVPDLRVGDELEVAMTRRSDDPTLAGMSAGFLMIAPSPPRGRYGLSLTWDRGQEPAIKAARDLAALVEERKHAVVVRLDNPAMLTPPKEAPPRYYWQRIVEYTEFRDWQAISKHFAPLFAKAAELGERSALKTEANRIAAEHARPLDRAGAALKLVQRDVRYVYVGLNGGNLTPAGAEETWQRRYGDCKGKTTLLLALLSELGIHAEAVLVSNGGTDDGLDERLPNPGMFDHVLVRVSIDGKTYWLDGTFPPVVRPSSQPMLPYRWVLPLSEQGRPIERIAWQPAVSPNEITLYEIDARNGFDQPARISTTIIARGLQGLKEHVQFSAVPAEQLTTVFRQQLVGNAWWQTIDQVLWRYDERAQASILTIAGTGKPEWDDDGDGARSLALPGGGFSPPDRRVRTAGEDPTLPFYNQPDFDCHVTTVRLPKSTEMSRWSFKPGYDTVMFGRNYYRAVDLRDGAIRMIRGSRIVEQEIDVARASKDNDRITAFDNSKAWIFYTPANAPAPLKERQRVPATFDIDWTADVVPCTSSSASGIISP